jgi:hypothetical protein
MKTQNLLILIALAILISCTSKSKSPIEGSWSIVSYKWTLPDSTFFEYPGNIKECTGKWILSDSNSLWYFRYKFNNDSAYIVEYGDTKYKFDGKIYQETYISAKDDKCIGQTFHFEVSIKNDTLTISGPAEGEAEKLGCIILEKYVRK